jgi:hypothetical protein
MLPRHLAPSGRARFKLTHYRIATVRFSQFSTITVEQAEILRSFFPVPEAPVPADHGGCG